MSVFKNLIKIVKPLRSWRGRWLRRSEDVRGVSDVSMRFIYVNNFPCGDSTNLSPVFCLLVQFSPENNWPVSQNFPARVIVVSVRPEQVLLGNKYELGLATEEQEDEEPGAVNKESRNNARAHHRRMMYDVQQITTGVPALSRKKRFTQNKSLIQDSDL